MFAYKSLVIARQLDELRAAATARRLAAARPDDVDAPATPRRSILDDPAIVVPKLTAYPYPAR